MRKRRPNQPSTGLLGLVDVSRFSKSVYGPAVERADEGETMARPTANAVNERMLKSFAADERQTEASTQTVCLERV